jgi:spermidine synthase
VLAFILLLFIGSGAAALIYEIVWFQMLTLVLGSSAVSVGVLLATFMGGMCLGSFLLPRLVSPRHHPLRVYAFLELAIGVFGVLLLVLMPLAGRVYTTWGGYGLTGFLLRGLVASVCLLPPTLAMGATLPAISRWIETTPRGVAWLGFFYAGNIVGAVAGSLLAGFYLLRVYDVTIATFVAAAINVLVAILGLAIAVRAVYVPAVIVPDTEAARPRGAPNRQVIYVALALSGAAALAAQVIWTRQLALLLGGTVYTFSLVLAVFLVGLGAGSSAGSLLARSLTRAREAFGWCQVLTVAAMAWSAYMLNASLPFWPVNVELSTDIWRTFHMDLARAFWAVLPAPILWGASFPLALAAVVRHGQDSGRVVGGLYAANTLGAIAGSLGASLLIVAWIGTQRAQQGLMVLAAISGLIVLAPPLLAWAVKRTGVTWLTAAVPLMLIAGGTALLIQTVPPLPGLLVAYGRKTPTMMYGPPDLLYVGEGLNSSVAVTQFYDGTTSYHNAGKIQASSLPQDMRLQRMLGHLTTLTPQQAKSVLVIGCGAGVTAGAVSVDPSVEKVTIAEIEPLVPRVVSTYFGEFNHDVIRNPKVDVVIDDARHFLLTTDQKFDAITSDPLDPWVKGAAALYTKEFWELAKSKLNPGGVITVFVQLYESSPEAVKSEIATFFQAFPDGIIFGNEYLGEGYDTVLVGQVDPGPIDVAAINLRLADPQFEAVRRSLSEIGFPSAWELYGSYASRAVDLTDYLRDAAINYDRNLRLQYLAGLGLNQRAAASIYVDITRNRRYPEGLFVGSESQLQYLRSLIGSWQGVGTP